MEKRDTYVSDDGYYYTPRDLAIKWIVITSLMIGFLFFVGVAYWHAQRRVKAGLAPMRYHRWLTPRSQRRQFDPEAQGQFSFYQAHNNTYDYNMNSQAPPPYNPDLAPPPKYQPPANSTTKVDSTQPSPDGSSLGQQPVGVAASEPPPLTQPPAAVHLSGSRNPFR
ncbi:hypothetical protein GP486_005446 [Trichoglossum hirsutum]|uniref:Uncharacterized protein n=1 Tax=Trichoglossum hirsutum TaxID=265104 RepID=A0A9P8L984_9PEZI|nr:hypothetical protein GP486_005446 [Trichoglossum hirsutum]